MKLPVGLLLFFLIVSCESEFYDYYQESDLWRLPLIAPYELKNIAGAAEYQSNNDNWHLSFKYPDQVDNSHGVNVTMVNVNRGVIYGYGTANPCDHFIIIPKENKEMIFKKVDDWSNMLKNMGIDSDSTYNAFDLFFDFKDNNVLRWRNEIIK